MDQNRGTTWLPLTISVVAVVVALAPMPYGYYRLLRLWLCGVSLFLASRLDPPWRAPHGWLLGGLAVLYNPVLPVALGDKSLWTIANVGTVCYMALVTHLARSPRA